MGREFTFMNADDVRLDGQDVVEVRPSLIYYGISHLVASLIFYGVFSVLLGFLFVDYLPSFIPVFIADWLASIDKDATFFLIFFSFMAGIFYLMTRAMFKKARLSRSWVVKACSRGLYIQYRSFLNQMFEASDDTVMFIPAAQISWMREVRYTKVSKDSDGDVYSFHKALDIHVRRLEHEQISAAFVKESRRKSKGGVRWGHVPVALIDENILRVQWNAVQPKIGVFIDHMSQWYMTKEGEKLGKVRGQPKMDLQRKLSAVDPVFGQEREALEIALTEAIEQGRKIEAIKLARELYGLGLKEAKDYVEKHRA